MNLERVFKSKIGLEFLIPLLLILGWTTYIVISEKAWMGLAIMIGSIIFVASFYLRTYYVITADNKLKIVCGFFSFPTIDILSIKKIKPTKNPLSSPALSIDRLEITYSKFGSILISPANKVDFVSNIKSINPHIEVAL